MSDRIRLIDALRGLSLAGIAMAHFGEQYLGFMSPPGQPYNIHGTADGVLEALSWIFIRGKGFGIFSFMFGLSFALQMQRAERHRPGTDFRPRFAWRLLILFAIGWLHGLAYSGDILTVYAALGIPLILFYRVRDRWLIVLAVLLLVGAPRVAQRLIDGPLPRAEQQSLQDADERTGGGALARGHQRRHSRDRPTTRDHGLPGQVGVPVRLPRPRLPDVRAVPPRPLGRTATALRGRRGAATALRPRLALDRGAHLADPLDRRCTLRDRTGRGQRPVRPQPQPTGTLPDFTSWPVIAGMGVFDGWNNAMTLFYVASFALLFLRPRWQPGLLHFGPVGRMALSIYVGQTVVGVLVFFGCGLGLLGRYGNSLTMPLGLAVFAVQLWAARVWLVRFRFGPLEWAWRSLTWLRPRALPRFRRTGRAIPRRQGLESANKRNRSPKESPHGQCPDSRLSRRDACLPRCSVFRGSRPRCHRPSRRARHEPGPPEPSRLARRCRLPRGSHPTSTTTADASCVFAP